MSWPLVTWANTQLGVKERRGNRTRYGARFGVDGLPWCGSFVATGFVESTYRVDVTKAPWDVWLPDCTSAWNRCAHQGWTVKKDDARPDDVLVFDFPGGDREDHVGVFVAWVNKARGIFLSIEGNTGANNTNGGEVMLRTRYMTQVRGVIRFPFTGERAVTIPSMPPADPIPPTPAAADYLKLIRWKIDNLRAHVQLTIGDGTPFGRNDDLTRDAVRTMQHGLNTARMPGAKDPGLWNGGQLILLLEDGQFSTQTRLVLIFWQRLYGLLDDGVFGPASYTRMFG